MAVNHHLQSASNISYTERQSTGNKSAMRKIKSPQCMRMRNWLLPYIRMRIRSLYTNYKRKLISCLTSTSLLRNHCYCLLLQSCARFTLLSTVIYAIKMTKCAIIATIVGTYRGAAHSRCNLMYRISKSGWQLPVAIHNFKGYDGHLIVKAVEKWIR